MNETLKVAQHKVSQTQSLADSLEERNQYFKHSIEDINKKIEAEEKLQNDEVTQFEDSLSEVSEKLFSARTSFSEENLQKSLAQTEDLERKLTDQVNNNAKKLEDMEEDYTKQKSEQHIEEPPYCEIPVEIRKEVWSLFEDENKKAKECLQDIEELINSAKQMMEVDSVA